MGQKYEQLSLEQRCTIARYSQAGKTIRKIAAAMDRAPSTIARELKRNRGAKVGYQPVYAEQQAKSRRWRGSRLLRQPSLQAEVLQGLRQGWSAAQVAGRLKRENRRTVISYESIYRFIDSQIRRTQDYSWRHYLPRGKSQRGWRGRKGGSLVDRIERRVAIDRRPAYIHKRRQPGHWEGDLMLFAKYGQAVLVSHERRSRLLVVSRQPNKAADPVATKLTELFRSLPDEMTSALLRFPDGRLAEFTSSFNAADVASYRVVGTKGDVRLDQAYEYVYPIGLHVTIKGESRKQTFRKRDQFAPELEYFSNCILDNRTPEPSGMEGIADVRIIEALYRSAKRRRPVKIEPVRQTQRPSIKQTKQRPAVEKPALVHAESTAL